MGVMDKLLRRSEAPKPLFGGEKCTVGYNAAGNTLTTTVQEKR